MDMVQWIVLSAYVSGMVGTWYWFKAGCTDKGDKMDRNDYAMTFTCMVLWPFILSIVILALLLAGICFIPYFFCKWSLGFFGWLFCIFSGIYDDEDDEEDIDHA